MRHDYSQSGPFYRYSKGRGKRTHKTRRRRLSRQLLKQNRKRNQTRTKRRFNSVEPRQTTAEYRRQRAAETAARKRWACTRTELAQKALERLEIQRRIEGNNANVIQAIVRRMLARRSTPTYTTALLNCSSKEDVMPRVAVSSNHFIGFGCDGHGGKSVTKHIASLSSTIFEEIHTKGPLEWVDERKAECKPLFSGGMITAFSGNRLQNGSWAVDIAWRGDAPFAALLPDGSAIIKQDHTPFSLENDPSHDPASLGYTAKPSGIIRWEITPDGKMAMSQRREQGRYCKCNRTGKMIAAFTVLGDSAAFYDIPTGSMTIIVPKGTRLIWGSDGWSDVIHPEDPFFRQPNLTAQMVTDEAHARWTTRQMYSIDLDKYKSGQACPDLHMYSGFGPDDISVGVLDLP